MVLYPILLSQSWSTTVPNFMLVSGIAQSGQILALSLLAITTHTDVTSRTRGLNFGPSLHLHPCFVYASSEGSGKSSLLDNAISTSTSCTDLLCSTLKLHLYTVGKKLSSLFHDKM